MATGINSQSATELQTRARTLLKRDQVKFVRFGDFAVENTLDGDLWVYYQDTQARSLRMIMNCYWIGDIIINRVIADAERVNLALAAIRTHMILDDLADI